MENRQKSDGKYSEYDHLFYEDGRQLGEKAARETTGDELLFDAVETMYQSMDQLIDSLLAMGKRQGVKVDCRKGCSWCCHQPVFANTYELQYLASFIRKNFTQEELDQVHVLALEKNDKAGKLDEKQVLSYKHPCPLLKDGACTAYAARPLACRIYLSMKVDTCIQFFQQPDEPGHYPALLDFPLRAGRMMNEGFFAALKEHSRSSHELRLEEGLVEFLKQDADPGSTA
ncbi:MAG: YkgJ family cysteine cluster protein [Prolixibacteraceae bacterium]